MKYKYILFDYDNTTVDSLKWWHKVMKKECFYYYGLKPNKKYLRGFANKTNNQKADLFIQTTGVDATVPDIRELWDSKMANYYLTKVKLLKGIKPFLNFLKAKKYKILLVTASEYDVVAESLKNYGLDGYYGEIITETAMGYPKSDVRFFKKLLTKLNVSPDKVIFFEDFAESVENATLMGIDCVGVKHSINRKKHWKLHKFAKLVIKNYKNKKRRLDNM